MEGKKLLRFISRILIALGVLGINLVLFTYLAEFLCRIIYHLSIQQLLLNNIETPTTNIVDAIRMFQGIVSFGSFVFSSLVLALIFKQKPIEYLGLQTFPKPIFLFIIPLLLFASMPFLSWLLEINGKLQLPDFLSAFESNIKALELQNEKLYELLLRMDNYGDLFINLLVMALIPAVGEELFCRGVLLNIFFDYSGKFFKSIVIVALIFTLLHMQIYKFVPMMALAILLGVFINWTQGIWASILYHFLNNTMAVLGSFYFDRGYINLFTDQNAQLPIIYIVASFFVSIAIIILTNKYSKKIISLTNE